MQMNFATMLKLSLPRSTLKFKTWLQVCYLDVELGCTGTEVGKWLMEGKEAVAGSIH